MVYDFSVENFSKLSEFIYRKTGIYLEKDKHYEKLSKKLEGRFKKLGVDSFRKYFFILRFEDKSGSEFQELINLITVNETYFFRENHQFEVLIDTVLPAIDRQKRDGELLRILCSPCSSGEEPYSIAIHLLESDDIINRRDIEIVGIDIDNTIIEKAQKGVYNDRSLHALSDGVKSRYFKKRALGYEIVDDIKEAIDLKVVNVFDKVSMRKLGKFDVIFSRNMLIYFDDASRKEVAMTFYELLNPKGFIFLGHAEYMSRIVSVFTPQKSGEVLYYQK